MIHLWNHLASLLDASGHDKPEGAAESPVSNTRLTSAAWIGWYEEDA
ncbi:hypothetical protein SAMN06272721_101367 [Arthrobacter sp. P2b]|nr:hypothetical protein SAMN06272721_101367 [Arthrobacter sp. P2b]